MQRKLQLLIAAMAAAGFTAGGSALAQSSQVPNQPSDVKSTLSGDSTSGDKTKDQSGKNKSGNKSGLPTPPNKPISVTPPPSSNNNTTSVGVDTPPADANASAGPGG